MPVRPISDADITSTTGNKYPNPFFDLARNFIPKNIKTLFKYCRTFFYTNGFLNNIITKLTEYPITDILYENSIDSATRDKYDTALHDKLKIKSFLISIGLDYFTYGNAFISASVGFRRFLKCSSCGNTDLIDNIKNFKLKKFQFHGKCDSCGAGEIMMSVEDEYFKSIDNFDLVRWSPENIDIEFNPITGKSTYFYSIPPKIKSQIISGNKTILKGVPAIFLKSLKKRKKIELDQSNFYHFKRPTLAEEDMGWGKPIILPALKEIYYLQTLRRGNEAIANEHIVPKKAIHPANTTTLDPFTQMNLGKWKGQMEDQIKKWKKDPNHIGVFPIPIGYQELGGNARALLLTPEMRFLEESIINSLGVPVEFIKGGGSWTSSSVSLRIVENHFLTYRELLTDFLNHFVLTKINKILSYPKVKVHFKKFKMADDASAKQLAINLNHTGKISDARLLDEFGYNYAAEQEALQKTQSIMNEQQSNRQIAAAEAQGKAGITIARYNVRAQQAAQSEQTRLKAELFGEELARENQGIPADPAQLIERYSYELLGLPQAQQKQRLQKMAADMPITYGLVTERMNQIMMIQQQQAEQAAKNISNQSQNNQQSETQRVQDDSEKQKGQTRGNV